MKTEHNWGWPIAGYLFLGGLGGGCVIVSSAADLFWGQGQIFALGSLVAAILIGLGSGLLIFELGRPLQFWRVFSTQKAIMTVGAWMLSILIVTSVIYFSFWPVFSPWREAAGLRQAFAGLNLILGLGVCTYTGILLGNLRARRFWNTPVLPVLFLVSGLSNGLGAQSLMAGAWPYMGSQAQVDLAHARLQPLDLGLISLELVIVLIYVLMMRSTAGEDAGRIAEEWLSGPKKLAFWGGLVGAGLLIPGLLYIIPTEGIGATLAPIFVLVGGLVLRFLVVYADKRTQLPGEAEYYSRLPDSDELFLKAWK